MNVYTIFGGQESWENGNVVFKVSMIPNSNKFRLNPNSKKNWIKY